MKKLLVLIAVIFLGSVAACARNPVTGKRQIVLISEGQEIAMGAESHVQAEREYGFVPQAAVQTYLQQAGRKLAAVSHRPNLEWHYTVVDSPVINAFAIPGGYVYFTRGILAHMNTEAELAGVMGHEIAHVTARHSVSQITRSQFTQLGLGAASIFSPSVGQFSDLAGTALGVWFLKFGRDDERQADQLGIEYAAKAGYDPREVSNFFEVLRRLSEASDRETIPGWLSTHPDPGERVQTTRATAQQWITQLGLTSDRMLVNRDAHLRSIDGLIFGTNPREGFNEEGRFYHPELQFQIAFPPGWQVENTRTAVYAMDPANGAQMQLKVAEVPAGTTAEAYARQLAANGVTPVSGGPATINGNRAFVGLYSMQSGEGPQRRVLPVVAAFIEYRQRLFECVGVMTNLNRYQAPIETAIRSFDRLTNGRILAMQPDRLRIYTARQGDTLDALADRYGNPRVTGDDLAILNRLAASQSLTPGRLVKVVEKGF
jgi:predicted Zn-dependent protease